ncbi:DUF192 domain-containing protein [Celeribacter litoreus]|uniref:DUF192 domain-containing protein n=1 Tax=Celeribacter litoreus TaxID=2876714 RepID=UPI001CCD51B2|nr:DUF192 domain-containing protein [Celeribacter litoreus]MCA0043571.1 DUF192 domain-containing protein [Celeribacter litoreus]
MPDITRPFLWALGLSLLTGAAVAETACRADEVIITGDGQETRFSVEIADDAGERSLGLMHREEMARGHGMLFLYEEPQPVAFWMANTLIPLDMIFVDHRGVVVKVHENAVPLDRTPIPGGDSIFAVLEINGGLAKPLGIGPGDVLRHPGFGSDAADPCSVE